MATPRLEGITVLADDVGALGAFYRDALGLTFDVEEPSYIAFTGGGIRFAIFSRAGMLANTHDHPAYRAPSTGQAFELNFECAGRGEVDERFRWLSEHGAQPIAQPTETAWGHYTGFFADPEGNIHSLFAVLES
ncbi:VOC family protein [Kineococcus sp. NUM-3379]